MKKWVKRNERSERNERNELGERSNMNDESGRNEMNGTNTLGELYESLGHAKKKNKGEYKRKKRSALRK